MPRIDRPVKSISRALGQRQRLRVRIWADPNHQFASDNFQSSCCRPIGNRARRTSCALTILPLSPDEISHSLGQSFIEGHVRTLNHNG